MKDELLGGGWDSSFCLHPSRGALTVSAFGRMVITSKTRRIKSRCLRPRTLHLLADAHLFVMAARGEPGGLASGWPVLNLKPSIKSLWLVGSSHADLRRRAVKSAS